MGGRTPSCCQTLKGVIPKIGGKPPKWMVQMENPIKMDDLGGFSPLFLETPKEISHSATLDLHWKPWKPKYSLSGHSVCSGHRRQQV